MHTTTMMFSFFDVTNLLLHLMYILEFHGDIRSLFYLSSLTISNTYTHIEYIFISIDMQDGSLQMGGERNKGNALTTICIFLEHIYCITWISLL